MSEESLVALSALTGRDDEELGVFAMRAGAPRGRRERPVTGNELRRRERNIALDETAKSSRVTVEAAHPSCLVQAERRVA